LDIAGNSKVHQLLEQAYASNKTIGALCYAVGALVWARQPSDWNKSIIYGKRVAAHPREWDFTGDLPYFLADATPDNPGTDLVTPGFVYPLSPIVVDAVGPNGKVYSDPNTTREHPLVVYDPPFVTALSVESSIAFGNKLVEVLSAQPAAVGA
jgi:putative intracellular protease/amidase